MTSATTSHVGLVRARLNHLTAFMPTVNLFLSRPRVLPMHAVATAPSLARLTLRWAFFLHCLVFLLAGHAQSLPTPPERLTYQGYLVDANGAALGNTNTGPKNYDVIFRLWDGASGGNKLWAEQQTITVDNGYFSVLLGEGSQYASESHTNLSSLFASATASERYVEVTVKGIGASGADITIAPRLRLLTAPYAFLATQANSANNASFATNAGSLVNTAGDALINVNNQKVGVGKANPQSTLDVDGTVTATGLTVQGDATVKGDFHLNNGASLYAKNTAGTDEVFLIPRRATSQGNADATTLRYGTGGLFLSDNDSTVTMFLTSGNKVGIGTATPASKLDVNGTVTANGFSGSGSGLTGLSQANIGAAATPAAEIKFGSAGQYNAAGSTEALRIVRGVVNGDGSKFSGAGFTSKRTSQSLAGTTIFTYTITFDAAFSDVPALTATMWDAGDGSYISVVDLTNNSCTLRVTGKDGFIGKGNRGFSFIAIGAR